MAENLLCNASSGFALAVLYRRQNGIMEGLIDDYNVHIGCARKS